MDIITSISRFSKEIDLHPDAEFSKRFIKDVEATRLDDLWSGNVPPNIFGNVIGAIHDLRKENYYDDLEESSDGDCDEKEDLDMSIYKSTYVDFSVTGLQQFCGYLLASNENKVMFVE